MSPRLEQILITAGTPPHNDQSPRVTINVLKLNEVTHLRINGTDEIIKSSLKNDWESFTSSSFASSPFTSSSSLSDFLLGNLSFGNNKSEKSNELGYFGGTSPYQEISEKDRAKETIDMISEVSPVSQDIYIAVQQVGNGRVVRIVSDIRDFENMGNINTNSAVDLKVRIINDFFFLLCEEQTVQYFLCLILISFINIVLDFLLAFISLC